MTVLGPTDSKTTTSLTTPALPWLAMRTRPRPKAECITRRPCQATGSLPGGFAPGGTWLYSSS